MKLFAAMLHLARLYTLLLCWWCVSRRSCAFTRMHIVCPCVQPSRHCSARCNVNAAAHYTSWALHACARTYYDFSVEPSSLSTLSLIVSMSFVVGCLRILCHFGKSCELGLLCGAYAEFSCFHNPPSLFCCFLRALCTATLPTVSLALFFCLLCHHTGNEDGVL